VLNCDNNGFMAQILRIMLLTCNFRRGFSVPFSCDNVLLLVIALQENLEIHFIEINVSIRITMNYTSRLHRFAWTRTTLC
jgi:hypothetical protein